MPVRLIDYLEPEAEPISRQGYPGAGGSFIGEPDPEPFEQRGRPVYPLISAPISDIFNIHGAPLAVLGGVFSGGLPIGGPVTQIFRGGSAPLPNTLFISTITPSGPIGAFFIGTGGAPIGVDVFRGGGLPIGIPAPLEQRIEAIQPRTALVGPPALAFGGELARPPGVPIGPGP
ncbi:MAG TPA: hypothetical protein VD902_21370 [Symbiobacteriaceae bacterium]|nr:hypothetical protein [Symbiobacteriaceae bacterium]